MAPEPGLDAVQWALAQHGLSPAAKLVLVALVLDPKRSQTQLAALVGIDVRSVRRVVTKLGTLSLLRVDRRPGWPLSYTLPPRTQCPERSGHKVRGREDKMSGVTAATPLPKALTTPSVGFPHRHVIETLRSIQKPGYVNGKLTEDRLATLIADYPHHDHLREAKALADWETHGNGAGKQTADGIARFRNWLGRAEPAKQRAALVCPRCGPFPGGPQALADHLRNVHGEEPVHA